MAEQQKRGKTGLTPAQHESMNRLALAIANMTPQQARVYRATKRSANTRESERHWEHTAEALAAPLQEDGSWICPVCHPQESRESESKETHYCRSPHGLCAHAAHYGETHIPIVYVAV